MKIRHFLTSVIPLLLVLALGGARIAQCWDHGDIHVNALHIDQADQCCFDMEETKNKQLSSFFAVNTTPAGLGPGLALVALPLVVPQSSLSLGFTPRLLPSRASPF